jgi:hypothetical protein
MKITVKKTIEETHELELPAYRKNICYYYKIISEEQALQVCFAKDSEAIAMSYTSIALTDKQIGNEEEFNAYFNEVSKMLKDIAEVL